MSREDSISPSIPLYFIFCIDILQTPSNTFLLQVFCAHIHAEMISRFTNTHLGVIVAQILKESYNYSRYRVFVTTARDLDKSLSSILVCSLSVPV